MAAETRRFAADRAGVGAIDDWMAELGQRWGVGQRALFKARLCVGELAANVVEHGVPTSGEDHMIVTLALCDDGIGIEFLDTRAPFDPIGADTAGPADSIAAATIGGRGLALVRAYADRLTYRNEPPYNRVTFAVTSA
jgi:anti-sigma regulatory factor (Ser/Thr protein kinase)